MLLRRDRGRARRLCAAACLSLALLPASAHAAPPLERGPEPTAEQISRALATVKADPNLGLERTVSTLRWAGKKHPRSSGASGSLTWLLQLFEWLAQSARLVFWVAIAIAAAVLVLFILRLVRAGPGLPIPRRFVAPTHVQNLDIRPESLPADIGQAARALWDKGDQRGALALLYRGLLSRLAHVYGLPIRASSTEGDCLALTSSALTGKQAAYVSRLIRTWLRGVYGGLAPDTSSVHALCADFAIELNQDPNTATSGALTAATSA